METAPKQFGKGMSKTKGSGKSHLKNPFWVYKSLDGLQINFEASAWACRDGSDQVLPQRGADAHRERQVHRHRRERRAQPQPRAAFRREPFMAPALDDAWVCPVSTNTAQIEGWTSDAESAIKLISAFGNGLVATYNAPKIEDEDDKGDSLFKMVCDPIEAAPDKLLCLTEDNKLKAFLFDDDMSVFDDHMKRVTDIRVHNDDVPAAGATSAATSPARASAASTTQPARSTSTSRRTPSAPSSSAMARSTSSRCTTRKSRTTR